MNSIKFLRVTPNYHRRTLEFVVRQGRKTISYSMPFAALKNVKVSTRNPFVSLKIDKEFNSQSISFVLKNGQRGDFHVDLVLYYCEPDYEWSPLNQVRTKLKEALQSARISVRVIAELLDTSPSQVLRLLGEKRTPVQLQQIARIASIVGYSLELDLKKKVA